MKVLFASSEVYPYAKTGGLADVCDALPSALKNHIDISRIMPFYSFMKEKEFKIYDNFTLSLGKNDYQIVILSKKTDDIVTYFIKAPLLSSTKNLYGDDNGDYVNNDLRFGIFCMAIVQLSIKLGIEILHLNDWHTALAALFIKETKLKIKTVFTIHNLAYQGLFDKSSLKNLFIKKKYFNIDGLEFHDKVNFLKAGIAYSNHVTTVSPTYAKEIQTSEFGCGLDGYLQHHKNKLSGILNGINSSNFDPSTDKALDFIYDKNSLENKHKNKLSFIKKSTLKNSKVPLFVMITRLVEQKGIDLLIESIEQLLRKSLNLFVLGEGNSEVSKKLKKLSSEYDNFEFFDGYNEVLSHQTYASADFLLMPSIFEPCGLNQFIAMSYGTVPIVHGVGGLKDSVHEDNTECGSGFVYENQSDDEFLMCVDRALELKKDKNRFNKIVKSNMECNFSFERSALEYLKLYRSLL
jgi:starch synthase